MKKSAGIIIIYDNKILLIHPTNHSFQNSYSIPKGTIEKGEGKRDAAIRETFEEVGIKINKEQLIFEKIIIDYRDKKNKIYKRVYCYPLFIESLSEIGLSSEIIPYQQLQLSEVDWAGFIDKDKINDKIFHRFLPILSLIKL